MKKLILIVLIMMCYNTCHGFFLVKWAKSLIGKTENTTNIAEQTKTSNVKALSDIKAGVQDNKTEIGTFKDTVIKLFDSLELKIVGYDKSVKAGRDVINIKKNDAKMIMFIFGGLFSFMTALLTALIGIITLLIKSIFKRQRSLDKMNGELSKLNAELQAKQTWLDNEIKAKEKYKNLNGHK